MVNLEQHGHADLNIDRKAARRDRETARLIDRWMTGRARRGAAARRSQQQPEAATSSHDQPGGTGTNQEQPGAARSSQETAKTSQDSRKQPTDRTARSNRKQPETTSSSQNSREQPTDSRDSRIYRKTYYI